MKSFCCGSKGILPEGLRSDAEEFVQSVKTTVLGPSTPAASGPRRWDICIVAQPLELTAAEEAKIDPVERQAKLADFSFKGKQRKDTYAKLRRAGIELHFFIDDTKETKDGEAVSQFVLLSIPDELLKSTAARIGLEKQLKPSYIEGDEKRTQDEFIEYTPFREYTKETHDDFAPDQSTPDSFFTSLERLTCLYYLIEGNSDDLPKPASLDLDLLVSQGVFAQYFSLKDKPRAEALREEWVYGAVFSKPPVTLIREYLGPKVALYFAWLHMYTSWLGVLGALSLVPWLYSLTWTDSPTATPYDNWAMPVYGVLSVIWAQLFLEAWKREQAVYQFLWNTEDFENEEMTRPEYTASVREMIKNGPVESGRERMLYERACDPVKAQMRTGVWSAAGFVSVSRKQLQYSDDAEGLLDATSEQAWFDPRIRRWRLFLTTAFGLAIFGFIVFVTIALQGLKTYIAHEGGPVYQDFAQVIAALCQSIFITLMSFLWSKVGVALNDWEMHRTDTEWEDALITKTFAFQFVNSYGAATYIAFVQGAQFAIPGMSVHDADGELVPLRDHCLEGKCYKAIYLQMLIIILSKQVTRNILAVVPIVVNAVKARCFSKPTQSSNMLHATVIEESQLAPFPGTHLEFIDMAIQFGYVSIFAVAFPIGSIVCWINNLLEKRADAAKVAIFMQRPRPRSAADIGTVQNILEAIGVLSVFANVGILYLSSEAYYAYFPESWGDRPNFTVFVISVLLEHLILLMKQVVAQLVPDTPTWVEIERARAEMLLEVAKKKKLREDKAKLESEKALQEKAYEQALSKFNGTSDTAFQTNDQDHTRTI